MRVLPKVHSGNLGAGVTGGRCRHGKRESAPGARLPAPPAAGAYAGRVEGMHAAGKELASKGLNEAHTRQLSAAVGAPGHEDSCGRCEELRELTACQSHTP